MKLKHHISAPKEFSKGIPITIWLLALVIVPLAFTFMMSFYSSEGLNIEKTVTLKNYILFFTDPLYYKILFKSIRLALVIAVISLAASYPLAYMVSFKISRGKKIFLIMFAFTTNVLDACSRPLAKKVQGTKAEKLKMGYGIPSEGI